jgi:GT2 family glycosyltransferase
VTRVVAVIPTIGLSPYLPSLLDVLGDCGVTVHLYDNREEPEPLGFDVLTTQMPGRSIYAEWNDGVRWAESEQANVLILNDDIDLLPCVIQTLAGRLETNPECAIIGGYAGHVTSCCEPQAFGHITPQDGRRDITNWGFIVRPSLWQDIDESYRIWYGDDDMIRKAHQAGAKIAVDYGVGIAHHVSTTTQRLPWAAQAIKEDQRRWVQRQ